MRRREAVDWLAAGAALLLAVHAVAALAFRVGAYGDGGWFDFALAVGRPFGLVWRNYPARLTHYLVQYLPAWSLLRLGAPLAFALFLAHAIWQFAPLVSLALCWRLLPFSRRALALAPAGYFALAALLTWAFPTETWLLAVFAWPAFFALAHGRGRAAAALGATSTAAVPLSYEVGALFLPLLLWAAFSRRDEDGPRMRRAAAVGAGAGLACLAVALALMKPTAQIAATLHNNAGLFLNPLAPLIAPAVRKEALIGVLGLVLAPAAAGPPGLRRAGFALMVVLGAVVVVADVGDFIASHYVVRSLCVAVLFLAMLGVQWTGVRPPPWRAPEPVLRLAVAAALLMAAAVTVENLRFALAWRDHARAIAAAADCGKAGSSCRPGDIVSLPGEQDRSTAGWGWGLPLRSMLLASDVWRAGLVRDQRTYVLPIDCATARVLAWQGGRPPALESLAAGICGTGPKLSP